MPPKTRYLYFKYVSVVILGQSSKSFAFKYKTSVIKPLTEIFQVQFHDQINCIYKALFIYRVDATAELTSINYGYVNIRDISWVSSMLKFSTLHCKQSALSTKMNQMFSSRRLWIHHITNRFTLLVFTIQLPNAQLITHIVSLLWVLYYSFHETNFIFSVWYLDVVNCKYWRYMPSFQTDKNKLSTIVFLRNQTVLNNFNILIY